MANQTCTVLVGICTINESCDNIGVFRTREAAEEQACKIAAKQDELRSIHGDAMNFGNATAVSEGLSFASGPATPEWRAFFNRAKEVMEARFLEASGMTFEMYLNQKKFDEFQYEEFELS